MVLFCKICNRRAEFASRGAYKPRYCYKHRTDSMVKIMRPQIPQFRKVYPKCSKCSKCGLYGYENETDRRCITHKTHNMKFLAIESNSNNNCLVCDLDFDSPYVCKVCSSVDNLPSYLLTKYIQKNYNSGINMFANDNVTLAYVNYSGNCTAKLRELENMFNCQKIKFIIFSWPKFSSDMMNRILERKLSNMVNYIKYVSEREVDRSEIIIEDIQ